MTLNPKDVEAAIFHAEQYWAFPVPDNDVRDVLVKAARLVANPDYEAGLRAVWEDDEYENLDDDAKANALADVEVAVNAALGLIETVESQPLHDQHDQQHQDHNQQNALDTHSPSSTQPSDLTNHPTN